MWSPVKESHFDLHNSSMSAAVQELYAELPIALSAERSALSRPTVVLNVEPETPAFVLSCGSGLPSEHQRTYGLKVCSQESHERPDYVGQMSGPRLRELLSKEPAGIGVLAGNEEAQDGSSAEQRGRQWREDAGATEGTRNIVEEDLGCFAPASKAAYWSKEKEPRLIQEEREPRPSYAERSGLLQSLDESHANVQATAENLPPPSHEAPGRKADGTVQFGEAGESTPHTSAGLPPGHRESPALGVALPKAEVSGTSTRASLEPVSAEDDALAKGPLRGEEDHRGPGSCTAFSATTSVPSAAAAGGAALWSPGHGLGHVLPSRPDETNLPDESRPASGLESRATLRPRLPSPVPETSNSPFQGCLELGHVLWEEDTGVFEVVCDTQDASPLGDCRCLGVTASCEDVELLEEWTSWKSAGRGPWPAHSREELSSDGDAEQGTGSRTDHSYSRPCEGGVETETGSATQGCSEDARANFCSEDGPQELQICQFAEEKNTHPKSNTSFLLDVGRSSPAGHSGRDLESIPLGSDGVQRDEHRPLPKDRCLASVQEGGTSPCEEASGSVCFWSGCSASTLPPLACHAPFSCDCESCQEPLQQVDSTSRTGVDTSLVSLQADNSSSPGDVHRDEEKTPPAQPSDDHSFAPVSSPGGLLDSQPEEGFSGTCAELGGEGAGSLRDLWLATQDCGSCADGSGGESHRCAALGLPDVEKRLAEVQAVERQACSPSDGPWSDPGSAAEAGCTVSGSVCSGGRAPELRTETNAEPVDGLEMCRAPVSAQTALPLQEHSGVGAHDSPSCENFWVGLDGAESSSDSLFSLRVSGTCPSRAEALESAVRVEGQRVEEDTCTDAEETVGVDTHVDPPDTNLEQIVASSVAGPGGTETVDGEKVEGDDHGNGVDEKLRGDRCVDQLVHPLERGRPAEDQGKEEPGRVHVPPSSFASDLCSLSTVRTPSPPDLAQEQGCPLHLEDVRTQDSWQRREALCQEESRAPAHHHNSLHSPVSWNWETPEKGVLEGPLMVSGWQEGDDAGQTVPHSDKGTQKSASRSPHECLALKRDGKRTPAAPVLVTQNGVQQAFQQNRAGHCVSSETESESVPSPLTPEPVELKIPQPSSECLECAFEQLQLNSPAMGQADRVKVADFSAPRLVQASLSDMQDKNRSPKDYSHPASNPLAVAHGQTGAEGSALMSLPAGVQPAQHPGTALSPKSDPSTSPSPHVLGCPPAHEHLAPTVSLERRGDCQDSSLASGNGKGSRPPQEDVGSPPGSKETPRSVTGSKAVTAMLRGIACPTPSHVAPSRKIKPSLGDPPREGRRAAEKTDRPACASLSPADCSGPASQGSRPVAGEEETAAPFRAEAGTSEEPPSVKDPSRTAVHPQRSEDIPGRPRQPQDPLPSRSPGVLPRAAPRAPLSGSLSAASPKHVRRPGRRWQSTERSQKRAGVTPESPAHAVRKDGEAPVESKRLSEMEECPGLAAKALQRGAGRCPDLSAAACYGLRAKTKLTAEHCWKRRLLGGKGRQPLGSSLRRAAVTLNILAQQAFAKGTSITLQESRRPKMSKVAIELGCVEAGSTCLSAENSGRTATASPVPLAPLSPRGHQAAGCGRDGLQKAFGGAHRTRPSLPLSGLPGRVWGRASGPGQFKAASKSNPVVRPACLKHLLEPLPQLRSQAVGCVRPAMQAAALRKARTLLWSQAPRPRASPSGVWGPPGLGQLTKDQAILRRLSALADTLQAPRELTPLCRSAKLLPVTGRCHPHSSRKLLDVFSSVNVTFGSWWVDGGRGGPALPSSASWAFPPLESVDLRGLGLGHKAPPSVSAPLFPVSFHITLGPAPARSLLGLPFLQGVPRQVAMGERDGAWESCRWTLSFLFSRSYLGVVPAEEGAWTPGAPPSARTDRGKDAVARKSTGCPLRGLQTLLALSSPRCCRLWMRKRTLPRHPPAGQRLTVLQLIQDLKGSSADLLPPAPHSLGRVLSIWSQHGPSEFRPVRTPKWPPVPPASASLGLGNSPTMLPQVHDRILNAPWAVAAAVRLEAPVPPFPASLPASCSAPEPALLAFGLSAPEFPVLPLDQLDASVPALPKIGACLEKADSEKRPKKVSQIRIRKTIPKPDPNLTPMGLPRPKRLKKKEFSLEEIYTNKNYKSPPTTRCLETIFEEPKERNGSLISVSQQKRKRILEFQDFTVPRKRRVRGRVKVLGGSTRAQKAALRGRELDGLLVQRLTDLEAFFAEEEQKEQVTPSGS